MIQGSRWLVAAATLLLVCGTAIQAQEIPADYQEVLTILGKKGDFKANVLKVNIPRSDLKVTVDGVATPTSFGFGGWLAMTHGDHGNDVMMGDLVLLQDEVNPVMSAILSSGLEVTALHNHFFWEEPRIFYMHVHGHGKPADLARMAKPAIDLIGNLSHHVYSPSTGSTLVISGGSLTVRAIPTLRAAALGKPAQGNLDTARLESIVGKKGETLAGGTFKFTIGRDDLSVKEMGATINARMGLNTWAAFFGSDTNSVIAGDVAMLEGELTSVLKSLRSNGLDVVAIHHHMTGTHPMIIFLHYWGKGPAEHLAQGFRAALDELGKNHH